MAGQQQTSKQKLDPYLKQQSRFAIGEARNIYDQAAPLPNAYVPISAERRQGLQSIADLSRAGSPVGRGATDEYLRTISGGYLSPDSNPWLRANVEEAARSAAAAPTSLFAGGGRFASGALLGAATDAARRTAQEMYGANYQQERDRMAQYLGMTPTASEAETIDASRLMGVGSQYEADTGAQRQEELRQFMWPREQLAQFEGSLSGSPLTQQGSIKTSQPFDWTSAVTSFFRPV